MGGALLAASLALALLAAATAPPSTVAKSDDPPRAAGENDRAARARVLEELGKTEAAAREYEAAFQETHDAENLYHLAICKRILGDYSAAREALRGYLREAPDGPLAGEVERQLAHLAVLIEARGLRSPKPAKKNSRAIAKPRPNPAPATPSASASSAPSVPAVPSPPSAPLSAPSSATRTAVSFNAAPSTALITAPPTLPTIPPPPPARENLAVLSNAQEAPAAALPAAHAQAPTASTSHAALWLLGGGVALGATGTALCVGAHQMSTNLNDRYNAGELTSADLPRYSKAHAEGIAGTALIGTAVLALGAAAVLAW